MLNAVIDNSATIASESELERYFAEFRKQIIGAEQTFTTPFGEKKLVYADWTASGRAYEPIEAFIQKQILPFVGNTHTETTVTGTLMSNAYESAKTIIKQHVNAGSDDVLIFCGSGMTAAVNKLQRLLGLRLPERLANYTKSALQIDESLCPVVFVTHMEHHSNHINWLETIATVEVIQAGDDGNVDLAHLEILLKQYKHRKTKIAAVTACSNVTGIQTPYHEVAKIIHEHGGLCLVDFACSAPYVEINMHPVEKGACLDAIYFSPHKFLGGPGTPGVLIFDNRIYKNNVPDQPGGGTVVYSNPWGGHEYIANIEQREDGGTPPFLQGIKAAMCVRLKEEMGVEKMRKREEELLKVIFDRLPEIRNVEVFEDKVRHRLGVISFMINGAHYNLIVKLLNDRFGIQARGGCSCAGIYGHLLLKVNKEWSYGILDAIRSGDLLCKPGWVRISIHPTMTNAEIDLILNAIEETALHFKEWMNDYRYNAATNEYSLRDLEHCATVIVDDWFDVASWKDQSTSNIMDPQLQALF